MFSIAGISFIFLKEKMNDYQFLSMLISLFGVMLVLFKGNLKMIYSLQLIKGTSICSLRSSVVIWGFYSVCSKWTMKTVTPMMSILYSGIFGLLILLPFNLQDLRVTNVDASFIQSILYTDVISMVVCMVMWNVGGNNLGPSISGLFLNFNPVFTALLAFVFLGEKMTGLQTVGSVVVLAVCVVFVN